MMGCRGQTPVSQAAVSQGKATAIHCRAGIGRASVVAACTLVCLGTKPDDAFDLIAKARGIGVPDTDGQRAWVGAFADWVRAQAGSDPGTTESRSPLG
jgi:protein-tyrosine phosphatase